jgi:hypothetical protein
MRRREMRKTLLVLLIPVVVCGLLSCDGKPKSSKYENEELGFSFEYPLDYTEEPTLTPIEIARFAAPNDIKVPVYTVSLRDKSGNEKLTDLPERAVNSMKQSIPGSTNYAILEKNTTKLRDGSEAIIFQFKWVLPDGNTVMETVIVGAYRGDKLITVSGTTIEGLGISMDQLSKTCMTLRFSQ